MSNVISLFGSAQTPIVLTSDNILLVLFQTQVPGLRPSREGVMLHYLTLCAEDGRYIHSHKELAHALKVNPRTIRRYIVALRTLGFIRVTERADEDGSPSASAFAVEHRAFLSAAFGEKWQAAYAAIQAGEQDLSTMSFLSIPSGQK